MSDIIYWVYNNFILPNDLNLKKVVHTKHLSFKDIKGNIVYELSIDNS